MTFPTAGHYYYTDGIDRLMTFHSEVFLGDKPRENVVNVQRFRNCLSLHHQLLMMEAQSLKCWN